MTTEFQFLVFTMKKTLFEAISTVILPFPVKLNPHSGHILWVLLSQKHHNKNFVKEFCPLQ